MTIIQIPSIILPSVWTLGTETELMNNIVEHTSIEFGVSSLQEKQINMFAQEVVAAGVPGNLWWWIELSPVLSTNSGSYWTAIGGGGGALAPLSPNIIVAGGVDGRIHTELMAWTIHSAYARIVVQVPVAATPLTDHWAVQVQVSGKG